MAAMIATIAALASSRPPRLGSSSRMLTCRRARYSPPVTKITVVSAAVNSVPRQYCWVTTSGTSIAARSTGMISIQARMCRVRLDALELTYGSTAVAPSNNISSSASPGAALPCDGTVLA